MMIPNKQFLDGMHIYQKRVLEAFDSGNIHSFGSNGQEDTGKLRLLLTY